MPDPHSMNDAKDDRVRTGAPGFPLPPAVEPSSPAPLAYRPISGFAVAGFAVGAAFALIVSVVTAVALLQGSPFFFRPWVLVAPAVGVILCLVARGQIRASEGTQAGERLARTGFWLSLLTGLGYGVYYYVTGLAVASQANDFLVNAGPDSGFFAHLKKSANDPAEFYEAFLLTLPAGQRGGVHDEGAVLRQHDQGRTEGMPGLVTQFRQNPISRMFVSAFAEVEPLGVQAWDFENGSYFVRRAYRISTAEAVTDFSVLVRSSEGDAAGEQRKWFVDLRQLSPPMVKLTPLGEGVMGLRTHALSELEKWRNSLDAGKSFAFTNTVDATLWSRLSLSENQRAHVRTHLKELFESTDPQRLSHMSFLPKNDWPLCDRVDGKVRMSLPFSMTLKPMAGEPAYMIDGYIQVESKGPVDPTSMREEPQWDVRSIMIDRASPPTKKGGAPMPPP